MAYHTYTGDLYLKNAKNEEIEEFDSEDEEEVNGGGYDEEVEKAIREKENEERKERIRIELQEEEEDRMLEEERKKVQEIKNEIEAEKLAAENVMKIYEESVVNLNKKKPYVAKIGLISKSNKTKTNSPSALKSSVKAIVPKEHSKLVAGVA